MDASSTPPQPSGRLGELVRHFPPTALFFTALCTFVFIVNLLFISKNSFVLCYFNIFYLHKYLISFINSEFHSHIAYKLQFVFVSFILYGLLISQYAHGSISHIVFNMLSFYSISILLPCFSQSFL